MVPTTHRVERCGLWALALVELGGAVIATHLMPEEELEGRDEELLALLKKVFGDNTNMVLLSSRE